MAQLVIITEDKPLLVAHKELFNNHLKYDTSFGLSDRKKLNQIYDQEVKANNIRLYYNRRIKTFLVALIFDRLSEIQDYYYKTDNEA